MGLCSSSYATASTIRHPPLAIPSHPPSQSTRPQLAFHITNPSFNPGTQKKKQAALAQQIFDCVGCVAALRARRGLRWLLAAMVRLAQHAETHPAPLCAGAVSTIVAAWSPGHCHVKDLGSEVLPLGGFNSSPRTARLDLVSCILLSFLSRSEAASHAAAMVPKQAVLHLVQALNKRLALAPVCGNALLCCCILSKIPTLCR